MPENNRASEQNIAEVLEMLRQSYGEEGTPVEVSEIAEDNSGVLSEDELKEKLRMQFSTKDEVESDFENSSYHIDEDFFEDAEPEEEFSVTEETEEAIDVPEEERSQAIEEPFEEIEEIETEELIELVDENEIEEYEDLSIQDEEAPTFEQEETVEIDEDIIDPEEKEMLQDMIVVAINEAISKVVSEEQKIVAKQQSNMRFPF